MLHVWKALIKTNLHRDENSFRIIKNKNVVPIISIQISRQGIIFTISFLNIFPLTYTIQILQIGCEAFVSRLFKVRAEVVESH